MCLAATQHQEQAWKETSLTGKIRCNWPSENEAATRGSVSSDGYSSALISSAVSCRFKTTRSRSRSSAGALAMNFCESDDRGEI